MNYSPDKLAVTAKPLDKYGGKYWVLVKLLFGGSEWIPSFHDLFRIVQAICFCEDLKYPQGRGRKMVSDFLRDCCEPRASWEELKVKYQIPTRKKADNDAKS